MIIFLAESYALRIQLEEIKSGTFASKSSRKEHASANKYPEHNLNFV